jgi:hypothetical protein
MRALVARVVLLAAACFGSGSLSMPDVARPLVAAAPAIMPALVHEPPTASRTSAEMSLV